MPIYKNPIIVVPTPSAEPSIITYRGTSTPTKIHTAVAGQYITADGTYMHSRAMSNETTYFSNNMYDANTFRVCVKFKVRAKSVDWGVLISGGNHNYKPIPTPLYNRPAGYFGFEYRDGNKSSYNAVSLGDVLDLDAWYFAVSYFNKNDSLLSCSLYDESGVLVAVKTVRMEIPYNISAPLYIGGEGDNANTTASDTDIDIVNTFIEKDGSVLWGATNAKTENMGVFNFDDWNEFTEVEYIEATGTQWINPEFPLFSTSDWKLSFDVTPRRFYNYNSIFGTDYDADTFEGWFYSDGRMNLRYNGTAIACGNQTLNQKINVRFEKSGGILSAYVNDVLKGTASVSTRTVSNPLKLWLSGTDHGESHLSNIHAENADGQITLKPCYHTATGIVGMFDMVNNKFYTNSGTGDFIKGPDANA